MAEKAKQIKVVTGEFRLSFPSLFEKSSFDGQEGKYAITMLFNKKKGKADVQKLLDAAKKAVTANPKKWSKEVVAKVIKDIPSKLVRNGDEKDYKGYKGSFYINAKNSRKPNVVGPDLQVIDDREDIYAGCYCRASVIPFVYDAVGNKGVAFSLQNVQKVREGESFLGASDPSDDFDVVETEDDGEDFA